MVYIAYFPEYNGYAAVGGLDGSGTSASGWFNNNLGFSLGLNEEQTAMPPGDIGYWEIFVDLNGDGKYGTYDWDRGGLLLPDPYEWVSSVRVENILQLRGRVALQAHARYTRVDAPAQPLPPHQHHHSHHLHQRRIAGIF